MDISIDDADKVSAISADTTSLLELQHQLQNQIHFLCNKQIELSNYYDRLLAWQRDLEKKDVEYTKAVNQASQIPASICNMCSLQRNGSRHQLQASPEEIYKQEEDLKDRELLLCQREEELLNLKSDIASKYKLLLAIYAEAQPWLAAEMKGPANHVETTYLPNLPEKPTKRKKKRSKSTNSAPTSSLVENIGRLPSKTSVPSSNMAGSLTDPRSKNLTANGDVRESIQNAIPGGTGFKASLLHLQNESEIPSPSDLKVGRSQLGAPCTEDGIAKSPGDKASGALELSPDFGIPSRIHPGPPAMQNDEVQPISELPKEGYIPFPNQHAMWTSIDAPSGNFPPVYSSIQQEQYDKPCKDHDDHRWWQPYSQDFGRLPGGNMRSSSVSWPGYEHAARYTAYPNKLGWSDEQYGKNTYMKPYEKGNNKGCYTLHSMGHGNARGPETSARQGIDTLPRRQRIGTAIPSDPQITDREHDYKEQCFFNPLHNGAVALTNSILDKSQASIAKPGLRSSYLHLPSKRRKLLNKMAGDEFEERELTDVVEKLRQEAGRLDKE